MCILDEQTSWLVACMHAFGVAVVLALSRTSHGARTYAEPGWEETESIHVCLELGSVGLLHAASPALALVQGTKHQTCISRAIGRRNQPIDHALVRSTVRTVEPIGFVMN